MADRISINVRMDPVALTRLDALAAKLSLTRTAVIHLAVARLAELEGIDVRSDDLGGAAA
jgi:predicted transcriptional regulator